jgi:adenosylmethionine-8-amino-7-oxononanoate aminotransferase
MPVLPAPTSFLHPFARPTRQDYTIIVRGDGALVWDADGREYVDAMASLWYCAAGHGRTEIADAVREQLSTLAAYSCFEPFSNQPADQLADRVVGLVPVPGARVFFCGSGSEAVDTAIKLARLTHTLAGDNERTLVVSRRRGYHGTNLGGTSAQGIEPNREGWGPLVPEIVQVPSDDPEAIAVLMAERPVAAVITEPVQGAGGVFPPADGYLPELRRLCDRHGALLVFDEVITGFGRLGSWFAADHYGVVPDLMTFAKAVTSGYQPLGGVIVGERVRRSLEADPAFLLRHGYTYSGHPAACAAALANLEIIEREELVGRAAVVGGRLADGLRALAADGVIAEARGDGAVWAAGLHPDGDATSARDRMAELGVITRAIGTDTLTFCPPLVITDTQVDRIVDALAASLAG